LSSVDASPRHLALYLYGPMDGGAPRRVLTLSHEFARRGHRVDLVMVRSRGPVEAQISPLVRVVALGSRGTSWQGVGMQRRLEVPLRVPALVRYLRRERPDALLAGANSVHISALVAHSLARVDTRLVLRVASHVSGFSQNEMRRSRPLLPLLTRMLYPRADAIICVAQDVAEDLAQLVSIPPERITTLPNPVVSRDLRARAAQPVDHPWFASGEPPVVLAAGRLVPQKDFPTLIRAFARVRAKRAARLVILGGAKFEQRRQKLQELARALGVGEDVALPGLVENPIAYMARASAFVLSSAWEGMSGVLIEAMACGCPVLSTDCPGGSREILQGGLYGPLVPVGDAEKMAAAIESLLDAPVEPEKLRARAADFSVEASVSRYLSVVLGAPDSPA